jgi:hypothetical protein
MNERIRELARRVVGKRKDDVASISLFDEQIEQFAELIIAECCVALHPMLRNMISRTQGVEMIVRHFRGEE